MKLRIDRAAEKPDPSLSFFLREALGRVAVEAQDENGLFQTLVVFLDAGDHCQMKLPWIDEKFGGFRRDVRGSILPTPSAGRSDSPELDDDSCDE